MLVLIYVFVFFLSKNTKNNIYCIYFFYLKESGTGGWGYILCLKFFMVPLYREREEEYRIQMAEQFRFQDIDTISDMIGENGGIDQNQEDTEVEFVPDVEEPVQTKKRRFVDSGKNQDPLPAEYQHIRKSERVIRDDFYITISNLTGQGLSISEACKSVCAVGNGMFKRNWKESGSTEDTFDQGSDLLTRIIQRFSYNDFF